MYKKTQTKFSPAMQPFNVEIVIASRYPNSFLAATCAYCYSRESQLEFRFVFMNSRGKLPSDLKGKNILVLENYPAHILKRLTALARNLLVLNNQHRSDLEVLSSGQLLFNDHISIPHLAWYY